MTHRKRSIVTGGAGFIGSHLTERLLREGHEVLVLDDFSVGRRKNLAHIKSHPRLTIRKIDIAKSKNVKKYFKGIDVVFHLAALADIVPSIVHPLPYHRANVDGTIKVLEAARAARVKRFLYAASSSCYGIPDIYPTPETAPMRPMYPYALTKYLGEQYALHWHKIYKLPVVSLRFFNVYGPRVRTQGTYGAVFGVFLAQKLRGKPFTVVGDGKQTRDFTFVTDAAEALVAASKCKNIEGEIFNVGSGNTYSVNRLVELLGGDVIHIPKRPGEPDSTFADITKITTRIKWKPRVSFEKGVKEMLNHLEDWRDAPLWNPKGIARATKDWFTYLKS